MTINIHSLPPEIIQLIVESVEQIACYERHTGREFGANLPGGNSRRRRRERERRNRTGAGQPGDGDGDEGDDDGPPMGPGEALMAMFGGMLGLGGLGGNPVGGAGANQPHQQAAPRPARPANAAPQANLNPQAPVFTFGANTQTHAQTNNASAPDDSESDEMPPLESVVAQPATSNSTSTPRPQTSSTASQSTPAPAQATSCSTQARQATSTPTPAPAASRPTDPVASALFSLQQLNSLPSSSSTSTPAASNVSTSAASGSTAQSKKKAKQDDSDSDSDDMPALESVSTPRPSTSKVGASSSASNHKGKAVKESSDSDSDEMPSLEPVSKSAPSKPVASTSQPSKKSTPTPAPTTPAARPTDSIASALFSLQQLENLPSSSSSPSTSRPNGNSFSTAPSTPPVSVKQEHEPDSDADSDNSDSMPPLEPISRPTPSASNTNIATHPPPIPRTNSDTRAGASEPTGGNPLSNFFSFLTGSGGANAIQPRAEEEDSEEDIPALQVVGDAARLVPSYPINATTGNGGDPSDPSDDDEEDDEDDADNEDDDWEDEDEEESEEDPSHAEDSDTSSIASEDCTYEDGLPADPLLPLLYVSRPFLHAARKELYRKVHLGTAFQARLMLDSMKEIEHAARTSDEELVTFDEDENVEQDSKEKKGGKNALGMMVRDLNLDAQGPIGMGRGGGRLYIELIEKCRRVEKLVVKPMFVKSATKPLLKALNNLPKLKALDIQSSNARNHPFIITTPRIFAIQRSSPDLQDLTVQFMKGGEEGDSDEEDEMWEVADGEEEEPEDNEEKGKNGEKGDVKEKGKASEKKEKEKGNGKIVKRKGLKSLSLYDFDVSSAEISLILRDSTKSLNNLILSRPGIGFTRFGFASTLLTYGHSLTSLEIVLPQSWYPKPALTEPFKSAPPLKPKGYVAGKPSSELLTKVTEYRFILDAVMPYLPNLKKIGWNGPQASTTLFSLMPAGLKTVSWSNCPTIQPKLLARLLNKTINRTSTVTQSDGSKVSKTIKTKVARGLNCLSVSNDDLSWSEEDISQLEAALSMRECCLHLSGDATSNLFGGLGGIGGLAGGGGGGPVGGDGAVIGGRLGGLIPIQIPLGAFAAGGGGVGGMGRH